MNTTNINNLKFQTKIKCQKIGQLSIFSIKNPNNINHQQINTLHKYLYNC